MNHRALVFAAWYLLVPPIATSAHAPPEIHSERALSEWTIHRRYASEDRCWQAKQDLRAALRKQLAPRATPEPNEGIYDFGAVPPEYVDDTADEMARDAICVESNDPRVKKRD